VKFIVYYYISLLDLLINQLSRTKIVKIMDTEITLQAREKLFQGENPKISSLLIKFDSNEETKI